MNPSYLARLALARLPRPYTDEVVLHVFCEIERTPHLREAYNGLLKWENYKKVGLNREISKAVGRTLNAETGDSIPVWDTCEIVGSVSKLEGIESDWSWDK